MDKAHRYYVRSPDGRATFGFDAESTAATVALEYGPGAALVDTLAQAYAPMLQVVERVDDAAKLSVGPIGGWDTGRFGLDRDLIEAVKRGRLEIVHVFLAKGASANARDARGGTALHWAAARGVVDVVELLVAHGADLGAVDDKGRLARDVAESRGHAALAAWLAARAGR